MNQKEVGLLTQAGKIQILLISPLLKGLFLKPPCPHRQ